MRENKIDRNKEHFWIIGLSTPNKILYIELISLGTVNATLVEPMEVYSFALQKRTVKVILVHNHPSGEIKPSQADIDLTDRLLQVGNFLNVPVIDHLIISEKSYYSFSNTGLLEKLSDSKKYVLPYKEEERIRKETAELTKSKREREIARELKRKGIDDRIISAVTGLSEEEIKKLKVPKLKS
jgi:DNA repair protein RadC